jgi:hypothetical protein
MAARMIHIDELPVRCRKEYEDFFRSHDPDKFIPVAYRAKSKSNRLLWYIDFVPHNQISAAFELLQGCRKIYTGPLKDVKG